MLEDSVTAAEQHAKRARQEYGEHSTMPTVSQPPPYTIHAVSTLSYIFIYLFIYNNALTISWYGTHNSTTPN